jgi:hypothetical protein
MNIKTITKSLSFKIIALSIAIIAICLTYSYVSASLKQYDKVNQYHANITITQLEQIKKSILLIKGLGKQDRIKDLTDFSAIMKVLIEEEIMFKEPLSVSGEKFSFIPNNFGYNTAFASLTTTDSGMCQEITSGIITTQPTNLFDAYKSLSEDRAKKPFCFLNSHVDGKKMYIVAIKI